MSKFIIAHGWRSKTEAIYAASLHEAHKIAIRKSFRVGILDPEDMLDTTWAAPYTDELAFDCDLGAYEPPPIYVSNFIDRSW